MKYLTVIALVVLFSFVSISCRSSKIHEILYYRPTDYEKIEARLEAGENPNAKNFEGRTLFWRASLRGYKKLVQISLRHGADPALPIRVKGGETALHIAADQGHDEIVELLLEAGVDVNVRSRAGVTPLPP